MFTFPLDNISAVERGGMQHRQLLVFHKTLPKSASWRGYSVSVLVYGSKTWNIYSRQEWYHSAFLFPCLRWFLGIDWSDWVTNAIVLTYSQLPSLYALLQQCRFQWLGYVHCILDGRILNRELATDKSTQKRSYLFFKDIWNKEHEDDGYRYWKVWRHHQQLLTLETYLPWGLEQGEE